MGRLKLLLPNGLYRAGWRQSMIKGGEEITVNGYLAGDGTNLMWAQSVDFSDGRRITLNSSPEPQRVARADGGGRRRDAVSSTRNRGANSEMTDPFPRLPARPRLPALRCCASLQPQVYGRRKTSFTGIETWNNQPDLQGIWQPAKPVDNLEEWRLYQGPGERKYSL